MTNRTTSRIAKFTAGPVVHARLNDDGSVTILPGPPKPPHGPAVQMVDAIPAKPGTGPGIIVEGSPHAHPAD